VAHLRVFGCLCFVKELNQLRKLDDRSRPGVFIGYADGAKVYRVYDPVSQRVLVSRDVVFDETRGWDWSKSADHAASVAEELVFDDELIDAGGPGAHDASATAASPLPRSPSPGEIGSAASLGGAPSSASASSPAPAPSPASASSSASPASATPGGAAQTQIESATPLRDDDRLNAFYDGEPLRYRRIDNILGDEAVPEVEPRVCAELHLTHAGEPSTYAEAQGDPTWREAMQLELESAEKNRT